MSARVPDEVWRRLEPGRRGLGRRSVVRLWAAAVALLALALAGNLLWLSPLVTPRLNLLSPTDMSSLEHVDGELRIRAVLENQGSRAETVLDVGLAGPGLELLRVEGPRVADPPPFPVTLAAGERVDFALRFRVADCTAVDVGYPWPVRATVRRPWGELVAGASGFFMTEDTEEELVEFWCGQ